jgi:HK97 family phage prohead protease
VNLQERRKAAQTIGKKALVMGRVEEVRSNANGTVVFRGYASVTGKPYPMSFYTEEIAPGAFRDTLAARPDVVLNVNHGDGGALALARTTSTVCPLTLREDDHGLRFEATADASRYQYVRDIANAFEDGLLSSASFAFRAEENEWSENYDYRRILKCSLDKGDVSLVTHPASSWTSIAVNGEPTRLRGRDLELYRARAFALRLHGTGQRYDADLSRRSLAAARRIAERLRRSGSNHQHH